MKSRTDMNCKRWLLVAALAAFVLFGTDSARASGIKASISCTLTYKTVRAKALKDPNREVFDGDPIQIPASRFERVAGDGIETDYAGIVNYSDSLFSYQISGAFFDKSGTTSPTRLTLSIKRKDSFSGNSAKGEVKLGSTDSKVEASFDFDGDQNFNVSGEPIVGATLSCSCPLAS